MNVRIALALVTFILSFSGFSQKSKNDILFTVDGDPVMTSEFMRVYNKNLDLVKDESQKDIDNYLSLFVDYKLKLKEAKNLKLDQKPEYLRELSNYRRQLAKNYLVDHQVSESLVTEAYERLMYEVNASHILVRIPENTLPSDTLRAFEQISKLRDRVLKEGFEKVQKEVHDGQSVFAENLGYFSVFKMIYKFESVAYNTPVGSLSEPFRTRFGYHIIKVLDKRKNRGQVQVGHIMIAKKSDSDTTSQSPKERIHDLYKKIKQGDSFESLAKQFSEDKSSAKKGGRLSPFSSGQLNSKVFEDTAFSLNLEEVSTPIETEFGWHIIKLYRKIPIKSFKDVRKELEVKVKRDSRSKLINEAFSNKLRNKYSIKENKDAIAYFKSIINNDFYAKKWQTPKDFESDKELNRIGNKSLKYKDFADFLLSSQIRNKERKPLYQIVEDNYEEFLNSQILKYYEENLETENQDFANIFNEYRDGLLLFDLMEEQIWNAAKEDTIGLKKYYESHREKYFQPKQVEALVASSSKEKTLKKVAKYFSNGWSEKDIKDSLNKNDKIQVLFTNGLMDVKHQSLPEDFEFKKGVSKIYKHNDAFIIANVQEVLPQKPLSFEDAKGRVVSDYQTKLESDWLKSLHKKYQVTINNKALEDIKAKIKS